MKKVSVYPIVISRESDGYYVFIPDFEISTQGTSIADSILMARDAIGIMGIDMQDDGKDIPQPNTKTYKVKKSDVVTLVDVNFVEYRRRLDNKAVKKNCTIPYWLSVEAEKAGVNYSRILQDALMKVLGISRYI